MKKIIFILLIIPFLSFSQENSNKNPSTYETLLKIRDPLNWNPKAWLSKHWNDEDLLKRYIDNKENLASVEGIYRYQNSTNTEQFKFFVNYDSSDSKFNVHIIEGRCGECAEWTVGQIKMQLSKTAIDFIYDATWWTYPEPSYNFDLEPKKAFKELDKKKKRGRLPKQYLFTFKNNYILESDPVSLLKLYPAINSSKIIRNKTEWAGNGSGIIISESGYIVTNYHVIKDADEIEVEFILNEDVKKFNAEVVQSDKINDLTIIKIFDINFDGTEALPYNLKIKSSDVGTKVYAYGYPMALTIMGKEIKVTDGIISSKSGYDGDTRTYTITAPIQGGSSGGPLFDEKGNLLGINSSGLNKEIADNVGYTIKSNFLMNLIDVLPNSIKLPSNTKLESLPLIDQIKEISKYVVLVKVK